MFSDTLTWRSKSVRLIAGWKSAKLRCTMFVSRIQSSNRCRRGLTFTWWGCRGLCFWHKPTELAHSFLFSSCVYFCPYDPFNCISIDKFNWQLSAFSVCSSSLTSALLVLSTMYLFMKVSFSPDRILCGWLGLKAPTNSLTNEQYVSRCATSGHRLRTDCEASGTINCIARRRQWPLRAREASTETSWNV